MTGVDVEHTKALEAAATPGPWEAYTNAPHRRKVLGLMHVRIPGSMHPTAWPADAEFIAHARTAVPALVAAVERVQALHATPECGCEEFRVGKSCPHDKVCTGCALYWPCPTRQALETP